MTINPSLTDVPLLFDRNLHNTFISKYAEFFLNHSFIFEKASENTLDILSLIAHKFDNCLVYNFFSRPDLLPAKHLTFCSLNEKITALEVSNANQVLYSNDAENLGIRNKGYIIFDEEEIPFTHNSFDLIISNLSLHFLNDVPGALRQYLNTLKPPGLFIANLFGNSTLSELRDVLALTDHHYYGGTFPRVIPMIDLPSAAELMQRARFVNPVVKTERFLVYYDTLSQMLSDIRFSFQGNCMYRRHTGIPPKGFFAKAEQIYREKYSTKDGKLQATIDIITLHGSK